MLLPSVVVSLKNNNNNTGMVCLKSQHSGARDRRTSMRLHSKFLVIQYYLVRPCVKIKLFIL